MPPGGVQEFPSVRRVQGSLGRAVFAANAFGSIRLGIESFVLGRATGLENEDDRFRLAARVGDVALLVQTVHGVPVEALPRPCPVVQPQVE